MGPDELVSREELQLVFRFMLDTMAQQGEAIIQIYKLLENKNVVTDPEVLALMNHLRESEHSKKATAAYEKLSEFLTVHKIARQYLDPP